MCNPEPNNHKKVTTEQEKRQLLTDVINKMDTIGDGVDFSILLLANIFKFNYMDSENPETMLNGMCEYVEDRLRGTIKEMLNNKGKEQ